MQIVLIVSVIMGAPSVDALSASIMKRAPKFRTVKYRRTFSRMYAKRILVESKRRRLDPIALTTVAWIESNFKPWARGIPGTRRQAEVGVWQLIPSDSALVMARRRLAGCQIPKRLPKWAHRYWRIRMSRIPNFCEDQEVADRRVKFGRFSISELRDHILGTYLVAFEIRTHIDNAIKRGRKVRLIPGCKLPRKKQHELYRYSFYNSGSRRPRAYYLRRLCVRYQIIKKEVEGYEKIIRSI
jgi:hypothetical protein